MVRTSVHYESIRSFIYGVFFSPPSFLAGTKEENIPLISTQGFRVLSQKDTGWYGKGIYFTQLPNYGEFYINNCLSEHGESFSLVLSWILMGRPFPVVAKMDGAGCMPGYDSHFCLVKGFTPCAENEDPTGDEIVIFQPAQVLPRYIGMTWVLR